MEKIIIVNEEESSEESPAFSSEEDEACFAEVQKSKAHNLVLTYIMLDSNVTMFYVGIHKTSRSTI